jgi:hypothetical protein
MPRWRMRWEWMGNEDEGCVGGGLVGVVSCTGPRPQALASIHGTIPMGAHVGDSWQANHRPTVRHGPEGTPRGPVRRHGPYQTTTDATPPP